MDYFPKRVALERERYDRMRVTVLRLVTVILSGQSLVLSTSSKAGIFVNENKHPNNRHAYVDAKKMSVSSIAESINSLSVKTYGDF